MTAPPRSQPLSEPDKALVQEVAALLEPTLAEIARKVDSTIQKLNDLLAQLDTDSIHALPALTEAAPEVVQPDGIYELRGPQKQ